MYILSIDHKVKRRVRSEEEAARWFLDNGYRGDHLAGGRLLSKVTREVLPDATWHFDSRGKVRLVAEPQGATQK